MRKNLADLDGANARMPPHGRLFVRIIASEVDCEPIQFDSMDIEMPNLTRI